MCCDLFTFPKFHTQKNLCELELRYLRQIQESFLAFVRVNSDIYVYFWRLINSISMFIYQIYCSLRPFSVFWTTPKQSTTIVIYNIRNSDSDLVGPKFNAFCLFNLSHSQRTNLNLFSHTLSLFRLLKDMPSFVYKKKTESLSL
jgi:hypothetical protein